jgi:hypothetical protein
VIIGYSRIGSSNSSALSFKSSFVDRPTVLAIALKWFFSERAEGQFQAISHGRNFESAAAFAERRLPACGAVEVGVRKRRKVFHQATSPVGAVS